MGLLETFNKHYGRPEMQEAIAKFCEGKEAIGRTIKGAYQHRPDIIKYPADVLHLTTTHPQSTSFHASVETWNNPLNINTGMKRGELDAERKGWDFLIDLDSNSIEHSKICAHCVIQALEAHGLDKIPIKFSGRAGFHIFIPADKFPTVWGGKPTKDQFPEMPRMISNYLASFVKDLFAERLSKFEGKPISEPYDYVHFDSILISSRHLVRCPYSFNEKSWLVSIPLFKDEILSFKLETAKPENVGEIRPFGACGGSVLGLLDEAQSFQTSLDETKKEEKERRLEKLGINSTVTSQGKGDRKKIIVMEMAYPPCIKKIIEQKDIEDGRKRRCFIYQAFLLRSGKTQEQMEAIILSWNAGLKNPLPENYVISQNKWIAGKEGIMPANCENADYYKGLGICVPDSFCPNIKNPYQYAVKTHFRILKFSARKRKNSHDKSASVKKEGGSQN